MKYDPRIVLAFFNEHGLFPTAEHQFFPTRKWRFDFAFLKEKLALECDGALFSNGRHSRGSGIIKEHEKFNTAAKLGWRVLRCTPQNLCMQDTIDLVKEALNYAEKQ